MTAHDLVGLREDELDTEEQEALHALLERDPAAREAHAAAQVLGSTLAALPGVEGGPSAQEVLARARQPRAPSGGRVWRWGPVLALAAAALLAVQLWPSDTRTRGQTEPDPGVRLEAVAEGASVHALQSGATVGPGEAVVFHVTSARAGRVRLVEHGPAGEVEVHRWETGAGRSALGGERPMAWTPPDRAGGKRRYVVEWCDEGGVTCVQDELSLAWSPR